MSAKDKVKYPKETIEFQKRFDVPRTEIVITHFACAHKGKFLKQGKMFITPSYIAFHAQIFGKHHKKLIAFSEISDITKQHYGILPNAIKISTTKKKEMLFASFIHRDNAFDALMQQWYSIKPSTVVYVQGSRNSGEEGEGEEGEGEEDKPQPVTSVKKKDFEMTEFSPKTNDKNKRNKETGTNNYHHFDVTKKSTNSPTLGGGVGSNGVAVSSNGVASPSLSDRAMALIESGAIVTDDAQNQKSRPPSQQMMINTETSTPVDDQTTETTPPTTPATTETTAAATTTTSTTTKTRRAVWCCF